MLLLKTNSELKIVFVKLIGTIKAPVKWKGYFAVKNNKLILVGEVRSLIFDFDNQTVTTNIMDIPLENRETDTIPSDALINNMLNIVLYAFGKWGAIGGLKVEKDYAALNGLFQNVFRPIKVEPEYGNENFYFFKDGAKITYEDVLQEAMELLRKEGKVSEEENDEVTPEDEEDEASDFSENAEGRFTEKNRAKKKNRLYEQMEDDDYELGLWHSMCWKIEKCTFEKRRQSESDAAKSRIGKNFYMTAYQCPQCGEKLYMAVYPVDKELLIETEEARVFMTRAYTCNTCNSFYTPRPGKLIQEGDVYSLKFEEDRVAYEDYREILGEKAEKTVNSRFNEYESERKKGKNAGGAELTEKEQGEKEQTEAELTEDKSAVNREDKGQKRGFFKGVFSGKNEKVNAMATEADEENDRRNVEEEEQTHNKRGIAEEGSDAEGTASTDASAAEVEIKEKTSNIIGTLNTKTTSTGTANTGTQNTIETTDATETPNTIGTLNTETTNTTETSNAIEEASTTASSADSSSINTEKHTEETHADSVSRIKNKLSVKTTEELKNILKSMKESGNISAVMASTIGAGTSEDANVTEYIETVKSILEEKLTAKYEARMGALDNLSLRQLSDLKKQLQEEEVLPEEDKTRYIKKLDSMLYRAEEKALEQKVELGRNKTYDEIGRMIEEVEKRDCPEELKEETIKKLKHIRADRAEREVEHLIQNIPLHLDRKQLSVYLDKLDQYKEVDLTPYRKRLEERKDMAEKEEIAAFVKRGGKKDRAGLWEVYEQLQGQDYKKENKEPFLEKIYEKIRQMDEEEIERICPSITGLSFWEGLEAYEKISEGMFLPEIKTNTLEMIERRLVKLKSDESVQLMRKIKADMEEAMSDLSGFYFYDAREEQRREQRKAESNRWDDRAEQAEEESEEKHLAAMHYAVNGYAAGRDTYEYPILVGDTTKAGNGKEGFVLTPDHIFYHTRLNSGVVSISDIEKAEESKNFFGKGIYLRRFTGKKVKLPNPSKKEEMTVFAKIMDEFVSYLQERPDSRSIEYLAKEKHDVKCCYRCGFQYKGGNICPKCGSKMNN